MNTTTESKPGKISQTKSASASKGRQAGKIYGDSMLNDFFIDELKDIYWAENHLIKTLPKMRKAASSTALKNTFADHLEVTKTHVTRLEQAFEALGKKAQAKKCDAMEGITKEGEGIIEETEEGTSTRDVGLILSAQKVEHYEISTYGGLFQLATTLGLKEVANLLSQTLKDEKEADSLLTDLAKNHINYDATKDTKK
jgi:ferritin-like metal-binding protein YciE